MRRMQKRGVELSINFLVMFILAIVVFGLGISFAYTIFNDSNSLLQVTQNDIDQQVTSLLCNPSKKLCVTKLSMTIESDDWQATSINVYNYFREQTTFSVSVTVDDVVVTPDEDEVTLTSNDPQPILIGYGQELNEDVVINAASQETINLGVGVPEDTMPGQYSLIVDATPLNSSTSEPINELRVRQLIFVTVV